MEAGEANVMKTSRGRVVCLGVHIVDILGRPVTHIPPGQGRQLLDEIRITAAGTAAGTSVDLAKLGAEVIAMGAIGDDRLADFLIWLLNCYRLETRLLARSPGLPEAARAVLALGPEAVLVSRGAEGSALITADRRLDYPAFPAQVVDTTGCGDACSAGFITGLLRGWAIEDATWLAMAAASLVVTGLGSDAGIVDFEGTLEVLRRHAPRAAVARVETQELQGGYLRYPGSA